MVVGLQGCRVIGSGFRIRGLSGAGLGLTGFKGLKGFHCFRCFKEFKRF